MNPAATAPNPGSLPQPPHAGQQQQQQWIPTGPAGIPPGLGPGPGDMQDPNAMMAYGGMAGPNGVQQMQQEFPDLDLNMMAYGFGDEFVAMGFGMGMGDGGWAF